MQFGAIFFAAVIGIAGVILASLSLLFWQARSPPDLRPDEKRLLSNWNVLHAKMEAGTRRLSARTRSRVLIAEKFPLRRRNVGQVSPKPAVRHREGGRSRGATPPPRQFYAGLCKTTRT
jgi:hypothetical protein